MIFYFLYAYAGKNNTVFTFFPLLRVKTLLYIYLQEKNHSNMVQYSNSKYFLSQTWSIRNYSYAMYEEYLTIRLNFQFKILFFN